MNNIVTTNQNLSYPKMESLTDENLYQLCRTYGENTLLWRRKFTGLLPEVFKRKLYERKGFISIFEFSKKLAGMSEEQVKLAINLEKRFEETPVLKSLLTEGKVSINKLARIVSIAKPENEIFLANQVQVLSKSAVETLVRDEKFATRNEEKNGQANMDFDNPNGLQKSFFDPKFLPGQERNDIEITKSNFDKNTLNLSQEVEQKLLEIQEKGIDVNDLLLEFLQKREQEIERKKEEISQEILEREKEQQAKNPSVKPTRNIPISVKRILHEEHGTKCSIKTCQKSSTQIHHTQRFATSQNHNPRYLAPLCKEHHEIAHSVDRAYCEIRNRFR